MDQHDYLKIDSSLFYQQIHLTSSDPTEIANQLQAFSPLYIINGFEHTTAITDKITQLLLPNFANDPESSELRYNK
jgi:hypothetical protein